ncbi:MAG: hypothetical protein JJE04_22630 [Acidobacteriia bacterium]|nr:hypothetical protein [Terriglobia bacterium]
MRLTIVPLALAVSVTPCLLAAQRSARQAPPSAITCPHDYLTAYTGKVASYSRSETQLSLTIRTDWDTTETVTIKMPAKMLLRSEPFQPAHWPKVEIAKGKLKKGMRATAWVCEDGRNPPVLDWQPLPER